MNVIIAVASKHGSTRAIETTIGDELRARGSAVTIAFGAFATIGLVVAAGLVCPLLDRRSWT